MLISILEEIKMLEDETFGEFYTKISDLGNSMMSLGKQISNVKLIQKILRSLPEHFRIKVTTIEESNDLEERLLETQLQLERVFDEKLIHMLSIQKCPTDKTRLEYVPPSTSDPPSTSHTIFVKPVVPMSPPSSVDKGKTVMEGEVPVIPQPLAKLPIRRKIPTCHHCGELGHIRPKCPHWQV